MSIELIGHQPIDFTYGLDACEELSSYCLNYQIDDRPMFQFKNSADGCGFLILLRNTDGSGIIQIGDFTINGEYVSVTINFNELGLDGGCYEIALYEICTIYGSNLVINGNFPVDLSGWSVTDLLVLSIVSFTYESFAGSDNGSVTVSVSGGVGPYTYSIDGINFQGSTTFSGLTSQQYTITVKDSASLLGQVTFDMEVAANCGSFTGSSAYSIKNYSAHNIKDCQAFDFV